MHDFPDKIYKEVEVSNCAMAHQANKHHCNYNLVVVNHAWLSTEHPPLTFGLNIEL